ncbi:MAG: hypothetical protein ACLRWU_11685 [Ruminococcus sp.]|uniref:hypothetical protein n=2 Tax=Ruminococcus TaxID=1263 RepID=UPI00232B18A5|nr:hypothetical protein [Ruminococcus bicirculans (ex Wegman et al. 2014)]MDB8737153.1 hypothetical protein [Ruminococcus bicirculans (ex Wegman et al. 2014)]
MIYKITLFDANFPSCTSGTASFFIEYNKSSTEMLGTASKKGNPYDIQNNLV